MTLASLRQILFSHLEKSNSPELINLWIETLLELGFPAQEIKVQLNIFRLLSHWNNGGKRNSQNVLEKALEKNSNNPQLQMELKALYADLVRTY